MKVKTWSTYMSRMVKLGQNCLIADKVSKETLIILLRQSLVSLEAEVLRQLWNILESSMYWISKSFNLSNSNRSLLDSLNLLITSPVFMVSLLTNEKLNMEMSRLEMEVQIFLVTESLSSVSLASEKKVRPRTG